ncbi:hypothetical protein H5410_055810 [Solanum commersonii]|uniref:Leucine-rich repeat-containing N-terminal plant-type domain-containing protein n=1 Tax=Solanum commersonii TaxID=4109 RepID=A0A9J5WKG0_SOLCO|nr:hypothetical protein H5410_055810 [Solanum commersonii]
MDVMSNLQAQVYQTKLKAMKFHNISLNLMFVFTLSAINFQSWNDSSHFCHWPGVTCGIKYQIVTHLNLKGKRLAGSISPYIGNLSFLNSLDLSDNSFEEKFRMK